MINGVEFTSNTMPAGGGVLALGLSKKLLGAARLEVGQRSDVDLERIQPLESAVGFAGSHKMFR